VSLGSNDEFFASDKDGKLSSRDPSCQVGEKKPVPRLAEIARDMMRKKAHTISSPTLSENALAREDSKPESPKLVRRSTFQTEQDRKLGRASLVEEPLLTRLESKPKFQATSPVEEEIVVKNLDDGIENKLTITSLAGQPQLTQLESRPKPIPAGEQPVLKRANAPKIEHYRRKSILIGPPPPVRPSLPRIRTVSEIKGSLRTWGNEENIPMTRPSLPKMQISSTGKEIIQPQRYQESPPAVNLLRYVMQAFRPRSK
jgi:hypothetical protein